RWSGSRRTVRTITALALDRQLSRLSRRQSPAWRPESSGRYGVLEGRSLSRDLQDDARFRRCNRPRRGEARVELLFVALIGTCLARTSPRYRDLAVPLQSELVEQAFVVAPLGLHLDVEIEIDAAA